MNNDLCFGQRIDPELGILMPWYTHGALDEISKWDLSDKVILEYGAGFSTLWWCRKAKFVVSVDHSDEWFDKVRWMLAGVENSNTLKVDTHEGDQSGNRDKYVRLCGHYAEPDIVIVDGIHRFECIEYALTLPRPLTLIVDNWMQDYVFICPAAEELLKDFEQQIFLQADHTDHSGHPWQTAIFYIK